MKDKDLAKAPKEVATPKVFCPAPPEQVRKFVEAALKNARKVWKKEGDEDFIQQLLYVKQQADGSWEVCDNFERFFTMIYRFADGQWSYRRMYSESDKYKSYSFEQAMSDASILYTG